MSSPEHAAESAPRSPSWSDPRSGGLWGGLLLVVLALGAAVAVGVLLHGSPTAETSAVPEGGTSTVATDVRCQSVVAGTSGGVVVGSNDGDLQESPTGGVSSGDDERRVETGEVTALCDKARTARLGHAVEVGLVGIVLLLGGTGVIRRRYVAWKATPPAAS